MNFHRQTVILLFTMGKTASTFAVENLYFMKNYSVTGLVAAMLFIPGICSSQVPVNTVTTVTNVAVAGGTAVQSVASHNSSVNTVTPSTNYTVGYTNVGNTAISSFAYSAKTYVRYAFFDTVIVRRVANSWEPTNGNKQHIYCQGNSSVDNITHVMPFPVAFPQVTNYNFMERVMKEGYINRGSDNVFNNDASSDLTFNNIERVDFVHRTGTAAKTASSAGFLVAERGGNDPFKVAAILQIDANGNPTAYGPVLSVAASAYGAAITNAFTYVMRKDVGDNTLRPFSFVTSQAIKAVFIRFSDLGVPANTTVFGYSLMGNDVTATTSAQLLAFTNNTYFPTTTASANGGMDLASAPGIFHTDLVLAAKFIDVKAQQRDGSQLLQWKDDEYNNVTAYQLEKSADGAHFEKIGTVASANTADYSFTDARFTASAYYRLKVQEKSGNYYYSPVLFAKYNGAGIGVSLYPNPAADNITISAGGNTDITGITIISATGVMHGNWKINTATHTVNVDIKNLPSGNYFVKATGSNLSHKTYPFIKQ